MSTLIQEQRMPYVKVKTKGQVTIPAEFRRDLNLKEGDLLEALVDRGGILLKPKTVVDRYDEEWAKSVLKEAEEEDKRTPHLVYTEQSAKCVELGSKELPSMSIRPGHTWRKAV